jgi:hypothetical protein
MAKHYPDAPRKFTITLDEDGRLVDVTVEPGGGIVTRLEPGFKIPGQALMFGGIALLTTQENPTCQYLTTGGVAFKVCR